MKQQTAEEEDIWISRTIFSTFYIINTWTSQMDIRIDEESSIVERGIRLLQSGVKNRVCVWRVTLVSDSIW